MEPVTASPLPTDPRPSAAVQAKAREFEAVFLGQITKLMMESAAPDDGYAGGHGEEMFRGVMAEQIGAAMARAGGVGLAPAVMEQIIKLQQEASDGR